MSNGSVCGLTLAVVVGRVQTGVASGIVNVAISCLSVTWRPRAETVTGADRQAGRGGNEERAAAAAAAGAGCVKTHRQHQQNLPVTIPSR